MGHNSVHGGGTDASAPGYEDLGRSELSPEVVGNAEHPTEADYNDAMGRHGTDDFTDADQAIVDAWKRDRAEEKKSDEAKPAPATSKANLHKSSTTGK